ncbi:hypothetical protein BKA66DRAFT_81214 [Pyrenochaeta sp. MPI-SDFR-AT-0127]|nr:hypothetical protein BKA66DRAFT_81214 [Pyrenochaeta sp. MPI-SDFR-AT-0127]
MRLALFLDFAFLTMFIDRRPGHPPHCPTPIFGWGFNLCRFLICGSHTRHPDFDLTVRGIYAYRSSRLRVVRCCKLMELGATSIN